MKMNLCSKMMIKHEANKNEVGEKSDYDKEGCDDSRQNETCSKTFSSTLFLIWCEIFFLNFWCQYLFKDGGGAESASQETKGWSLQPASKAELASAFLVCYLKVELFTVEKS